MHSQPQGFSRLSRSTNQINCRAGIVRGPAVLLTRAVAEPAVRMLLVAFTPLPSQPRDNLSEKEWRPTEASLFLRPTDKQMAQVQASFRKPPGTVLFKAFRHAFSVAEIQQLRQGNCPQADVVNQFIQLLQERCTLLGDRVWIALTLILTLTLALTLP